MSLYAKSLRQATKVKVVEQVRTPQRPTRQHFAWIAPLPSEVRPTHPLNAKVEIQKTVRNSRDFHIRMAIFMADHPKLKFLKVHRSTLSNRIKQWLFLDTERNVTVAKTEEQILISVQDIRKSQPGGCRSIGTFNPEYNQLPSGNPEPPAALVFLKTIAPIGYKELYQWAVRQDGDIMENCKKVAAIYQANQLNRI